jgi:hypothetical protein
MIMNGTQFMRPSFTLPANGRADQKQWDLAFLTSGEFRKKYKMGIVEYERLIHGTDN